MVQESAWFNRYRQFFPAHKHSLLILLLFLCVLSACSQREGLAPVAELKWANVGPNPQKHVVESGETLYAIAFRHDEDYRALAKLNDLRAPYTLQVGQVIQLQPTKNASHTKPTQTKRVASNTSSPPKPKQKNNKSMSSPWIWPVRGELIDKFNPSKGKKGINIAGRKNEEIRSAAGGIVAYAGNGLVGYGNLIIIKHDNQFLTAYGNNSRNFVREGQRVKKGQVIAKMGLVNRQYWGLHFEIRKAGKPINPLNYLQRA